MNVLLCWGKWDEIRFPILLSLTSLFVINKTKANLRVFFHIVLELFSSEPNFGAMKHFFSISLMTTELFVSLN